MRRGITPDSRSCRTEIVALIAFSRADPELERAFRPKMVGAVRDRLIEQ